eukprot:11937267-Ditylum_brightwellii.AAC.1
MEWVAVSVHDKRVWSNHVSTTAGLSFVNDIDPVITGAFLRVPQLQQVLQHLETLATDPSRKPVWAHQRNLHLGKTWGCHPAH